MPLRTVAVKLDQLQRLCELHNLTGQDELAEAMGVNRSTVSRLRCGYAPGPHAIAGLLTAFPDADFDDLFTVVPAKGAEQ